MDEPPGPMYAAILGGTAITYLILALTHATGITWIIPIPVAAAAATMVCLINPRTPRRRGSKPHPRA